ncbi:Hsp20/alpha crystallin family protein [Halorubellus sp. JP-L1]|uniref:DUF7127 family protein n=1 Tax=Halorubellus sp. JP-L1 TaxID=2715753 RepID=UPI001408E394|nr:Hsp20/alpha crystallin family protein [Halorubellus sp. JP-L1]NHN41043.1 Hsp20/alpha crystallin family protein [Halorubellus sp. JP-L1]
MNIQQFTENDARFARRYDYDDAVVVAADLDLTDGSVDVLEDTVIVVGPEDEQVELAVPSTPTRAFIRNGVLTIEMEANA